MAYTTAPPMSSPSATALTSQSVSPHYTPYIQSLFQKSDAWSTNPHHQSSIVLCISNPQAKLDNLNLKSSSFVWGPRAPHTGRLSAERHCPTHMFKYHPFGSLTSKSKPTSVHKQPSTWPYGLQNIVGASTWFLGSCALRHPIICVGKKPKIGL